mgnify:CR=1 FL=1
MDEGVGEAAPVVGLRMVLPVMQLAKTTRMMFLLDLTAWPTKILD